MNTMKLISKGRLLAILLTLAGLFLFSLPAIAQGNIEAQARSTPQDGLVVYLPLIQANSYPPPKVVNKIVFGSGWSDTFRVLNIYVMNPDGTSKTHLTNSNTTSYFYPTWSPDGTTIALSAQTPGNDNYQLMTIQADGSDLKAILTIPGHHWGTTWSPDGLKIAFTSDLHDPGEYTPNDIYVFRPGSAENPVNLTNTPDVHEDNPVWSPDGLKIAFTAGPVGGDSDIYLMNADGSGRVNLTNSNYGEYDPAWSPDSQMLAFYRNTNGSRQIFAMNADGSNQVQLTFNSGQNWRPAWSPDGQKIAFQAFFNAYADIYTMNADGSNVVNITNTQYNYASGYPNWH